MFTVYSSYRRIIRKFNNNSRKSFFTMLWTLLYRSNIALVHYSEVNTENAIIQNNSD